MNDLDAIAKLGSKLAAELSVKLDRSQAAGALDELASERTSPGADLDNEVRAGDRRVPNQPGGRRSLTKEVLREVGAPSCPSMLPGHGSPEWCCP